MKLVRGGRSAVYVSILLSRFETCSDEKVTLANCCGEALARGVAITDPEMFKSKIEIHLTVVRAQNLQNCGFKNVDYITVVLIFSTDHTELYWINLF